MGGWVELVLFLNGAIGKLLGPRFVLAAVEYAFIETHGGYSSSSPRFGLV